MKNIKMIFLNKCFISERVSFKEYLTHIINKNSFSFYIAERRFKDYGN